MAIPFPIGAVAGARMASQIANGLAADIFWSARWSDEISNDEAIDLKKLGQLAQHARRVVEGTNGGVHVQTIRALRARLWTEGLEWATQADMVADLTALRADLSALHAYISSNLADEISSAVSVGYDPNGNNGVESYATLAKPHAVEALISAVRARFV